VTRLQDGQLGLNSQYGHRGFFFSFCHRVQIGSGTYPAGTSGSLPWLKCLGCGADHSPPSSAEVKDARSCTSTPLCVFMLWYSGKHRHNFTFTHKGILCIVLSAILYLAHLYSLGWFEKEFIVVSVVFGFLCI
jgi:hypothetical protein